MKDVTDNERGAQFRCVAVLLDDHIEEMTEGICHGKILRELRGTQGFGYDPLFFYEPTGLTFAEMSTGEKNKISHRAIAFRKMRKNIESLSSG